MGPQAKKLTSHSGDFHSIPYVRHCINNVVRTKNVTFNLKGTNKENNYRDKFKIAAANVKENVKVYNLTSP